MIAMDDGVLEDEGRLTLGGGFAVCRGCAGRLLLLVVLLEARNQVWFVARLRKAAFAEHFLELGNLH